MTTEPQAQPVALPAGATDCHSHVVGPPDRWPTIPDRRYEPKQGRVSEYIATLSCMGLRPRFAALGFRTSQVGAPAYRLPRSEFGRGE